MTEFLARPVRVPKPVLRQGADDSLVLRRLTDVSLYGASHRRRFEMSKKRRRSNKETKFDRKNDDVKI